MLTFAELPPAMIRCGFDVCAGGSDYVINWFSRSPAGNLFLVRPAKCDHDCASWLVEKTPDSVMPLFYLPGQYKLIGKNDVGYPDVQLKREVSQTELAYSFFAWQDGRYVRTANEPRYRVAGVECGTRTECDAAAQEALRGEHPEQALKIWETVHGISWI